MRFGFTRTKKKERKIKNARRGTHVHITETANSRFPHTQREGEKKRSNAFPPFFTVDPKTQIDTQPDAQKKKRETRADAKP